MQNVGIPLGSIFGGGVGEGDAYTHVIPGVVKKEILVTRIPTFCMSVLKTDLEKKNPTKSTELNLF